MSQLIAFHCHLATFLAVRLVTVESINSIFFSIRTFTIEIFEGCNVRVNMTSCSLFSCCRVRKRDKNVALGWVRVLVWATYGARVEARNARL